jgi:hypothetical protein
VRGHVAVKTGIPGELDGLPAGFVLDDPSFVEFREVRLPKRRVHSLPVRVLEFDYILVVLPGRDRVDHLSEMERFVRRLSQVLEHVPSVRCRVH